MKKLQRLFNTPILLLILGVLAFGLQALWLGYYLDDWVFLYHTPISSLLSWGLVIAAFLLSLLFFFRQSKQNVEPVPERKSSLQTH